MKKYSWLLIMVLVFAGLNKVNAQQQDHFVYIQSDDKFPFDVTVNGTTYKSSTIGYVIIPKLTKGDYRFNITFPNKKFPDQEFAFTIDKVDAGFALKNYGEKGWGLYNLQTLDITMAGGESAPVSQPVVTPPVNNAFGNMLSEVVDDSTLNKKITLEKVEQAKTEVAAIKEAAPVIEPVDTVSSKEVVKNVGQSQTSTTVTPQNKALTKVNEYLSDAGKDVIFVDNSAGLNDTIRIFLPKSLIDDSETSGVKVKEVANPINTDTAKKETVKENIDTVKTIVAEKSEEPNNPFFQQNAEKKVTEEVKQTVTITPKAEEVVENKPVTIAKPDCPNAIAESEVDKLKKKIVSADNEEKMLAAVKKSIQNKCITTDQVKSLGALFPSDDSRFNFFSTIYSSVSDASNLLSLESQLIDPAYKKRYKALLN